MDMIQIPSPNFWRGRTGHKPAWIILHGTAGGSSAAAIANWFCNSAAQVSAHYVIGLEGEIIQCVQEGDTAWANGPITGPAGTGGDGVHHDAWWDSGINPNFLTISIEHVKAHDDNSDALTPAQQSASFALITDICSRNDIPLHPADETGGITGHFSMDPVNRSRCPGTYPWDTLWTQGGTTMGIPQGWHDDGVTLTAPNGIGVRQGFRSFMLANQWHPDNWPLEEEHAQNPLEVSNPDLGGGTQQTCRWTMLGWTAKQGVFVEWIGEELLAYRAEVAKLAAVTPPAQQ